VAFDLEAVKPIVLEYVQAGGASPTDAALTRALKAEAGDQANRCRIPADPAPYPDPLLEALCRRVAHNIGVQALPLGAQQVVTTPGAAGAAVGGTDAEVIRLEGPYRKRKVG
jgi:hypothetical protein